jgi:hypothetical protein
MNAQKEYGFIYGRINEWWDQFDGFKLGKASNIKDREAVYNTSEIIRGMFYFVLKVKYDEMHIIETMLQSQFKSYNLRFDGGIEFYNKSILLDIIPYLQSKNIWFVKLSKKEIEDVKYSERTTIIRQENDKYSEQTPIIGQDDSICDYKWKSRSYQESIINFGTDILRKHDDGEADFAKKLYIELPTGGGKSFIVYNLFKNIQAETIVIVSPRKIVNLQNISQKYLQILEENGKYDVYNVSDPECSFDEFINSPNHKIIIGCTQSSDKIYEFIIRYNITNIKVWFDEAHWGVEDWCDSENESKNYWLYSSNIDTRIFTSASPNKQKIIDNVEVFGELYSPIKVKELIELRWLANIKPYIYGESKHNPNAITNIFSSFTEHKRNYGFSFHNKQQNAYSLFYKHYIEYKTNKTDVKPFLLIGSNFILQDVEIVQLNYDYRDVKTFEKMPYSIGYVVAQYSMGYDFSKIDYICISDPKMSIQDIIQCIGRGIRPDELGENGQNRDKYLMISLPVYIDYSEECKYDRIVEVLQYLLHDIEIPFEEILFYNYNGTSGDSMSAAEKYDGIEDIKSILLDLLKDADARNSRGTTYELARRIITDKHIKTLEQYFELCEKDTRLPKEPDMLYKGQFTNWIEYLSIGRVYYDLETCKKKTSEYLSTYPDIKKHIELSSITNELCKIDELFPPLGLWVEYYNVMDLRDIITITNKKKKLGTFI